MQGSVNKILLPSALNYTGGKYKLLPQILPHFPENIDMMVDLFCGGCNVGMNTDCKTVWFNDSNTELIGMLNMFQRKPKEDIFAWIDDAIRRYGLSSASRHGYGYYGCDSGKGLGGYNRAGYLKLRDDFNGRHISDDEHYLMLYLLTVYSFNNQIRFNKKGQFNSPVGKRDFNDKMQEKLRNFIDCIRKGNYRFTDMDFREINPSGFTDKSFFYADPPYFITCATYNEQNGWTEEDEYSLLSYLEELDRLGIRFALSNVIENKGKRNSILQKWLENHRQFRAIPLDYDYSNSNYHAVKGTATKEVLVVNY